jgi:hypothetical protein
MTCASQRNITRRNTALPNTFYAAPTEHDTVKLADILLYTDRDGIMYFDTNKTKYLHGFTGDSIMFYYGYLFDLGKHNEAHIKGVNKNRYNPKLKINTYFYNIYHKGFYAIQNAAYIKEHNGTVFTCFIKKYDFNIDTEVKINESEVIEIALNEINAETYYMGKSLLGKKG